MKFRDVELTMTRDNGQYQITAEYKGYRIVAHTTDSEVWDWFNNEGETREEREKHRDALRHCYYKIVAEYENMR